MASSVFDLDLDSRLYDILNKTPDWTAESRLHASMYGEYLVDQNRTWRQKYKNLTTISGQVPINGFYHTTPKKDGSTPKSTEFEMAYDIWLPKMYKYDVSGNNSPLSVLILTHGVPVNRREWYDAARLLARFYFVITVDLLGMGDSSKPSDFISEYNGKSLWSWNMHAEIFEQMINDKDVVRSELYVNNKPKVFFAANDWGAGMLQKLMERSSDLMFGAIPISAISLNGYWVQQIGSLVALAKLPYPSETFSIEAIRFIGTLTTLLETMFHRTHENHNQYTMAPLQHPYVEISYREVNKNPWNTVYKEHAVRVLAEQASFILGNGELLPHHLSKNPQGLKFTKWNVPILMMWGEYDKMMPMGQIHRFANMVTLLKEKGGSLNSNLSFRSVVLPRAGHFAVSDQPEKTAAAIIDFMRSIGGPGRMFRSFWGFEEIARQDEGSMIPEVDKTYYHIKR